MWINLIFTLRNSHVQLWLLKLLLVEDFRARTAQVDICCLCPHNAIRFPISNHITYVKMVEIGAKLRELQMSSYDISNMSYFRIFCQLKIYARKTARETYAVFDFYHCDS